MSRLIITGLAALLATSVAVPVFAADMVEPPVVEAPQPVYEAPEVGGWYIRGDAGYRWSDFRGSNYVLYGDPGNFGNLDGDLDDALTLGVGVGYQVNNNFRVDLTGDYLFDSDFRGSTEGFCGTGLACTSKDTSSYNAVLLLANAYADLGTYNGFTPYVGAGIGGAHVEWDNLNNKDDDGEFSHRGGKDWRFAYAAMAGVSYCLTSNAKLDVGYRFAHIEGGEMFGYQANTGPGYDDGINSHEVRGGLRYQFGKSDCAAPEPVSYEPAPVYKQ